MAGWPEDWPSLCSKGPCTGQGRRQLMRPGLSAQGMHGKLKSRVTEGMGSNSEKAWRLGQICISERIGFTWGILFQRQTKFMKPPGVPFLKWAY